MKTSTIVLEIKIGIVPKCCCLITEDSGENIVILSRRIPIDSNFYFDWTKID